MPRRIIGQCGLADFKDIEHTVDLVRDGQDVRQKANLSGRQKATVLVVHHFQACGVPFKVLFNIREVLVWEMPDKGLAFEYKLLDRNDSKTHSLLLNMAPRKLVERR
jgi:hypothetical protein